MLRPTKEDFQRWSGTGFAFFGTYLHPNPRWYKYIWQIWTPDSPLEGAEFFEHGPRYCTAQFHEMEKRMFEAGASGFIYNRQLPRRGLDKPFDLTHPRWANREWVLAWEDDPDPEWNGHK
ncbi:hypothetical protein BTHA_1287 [Burkholderia thailandensis MSMB59]|uniref:hypothetical protein n=1 Tax=Burkholderia thailandensis TaxID=57975 RepID=UPI0005152EEC|nr:hypothetical protein [Burkholderia thailandensis]AIS95995.1 hypothetical protein BTHA_1287 [Burkholderia thailandensis MSMB59]